MWAAVCNLHLLELDVIQHVAAIVHELRAAKSKERDSHAVSVPQGQRCLQLALTIEIRIQAMQSKSARASEAAD